MSEELTQIRQILENNLQAQTDSRLSEITRIRQLISDFTQGGGSQIQFPLYFVGNENSNPRGYIGEFELNPAAIPGLYYFGDNVWRVNSPGQVAAIDMGTGTISYFNNDIDDMRLVIGIERDSPFLETTIELTEFEFIYYLNGINQFVVKNNEMGFFGESAARQSITETTADAAIMELQNILIAYGLATDNR